MEQNQGPAQVLLLQVLGRQARCGAPAAVSLSAEASSHYRDRELLLAALRKSRTLERQSAPSAVVGGITYTPPYRQTCAPAVPPLLHLSDSPGSLDALPRPPEAAPPGPAVASFWVAAQPPRVGTAQFGINSAFSARGAAFNGTSADAFADVGGLGVDCSVSASAAGRVSGDAEVVATLTALRTAFGPPTVSHKVAALEVAAASPLRQVSTLSVPVAKGISVARVQLKRHPGGGGQPDGRRDVLCLELARRGSKGSDSTRAQLGHGGTHNHGNAVSTAATRSPSGSSDSEEEDDRGRPGARLPQLCLELGRQGSKADLAVRWRQVWSSKLHTTAHLRSVPGALSVHVGGRPWAGFQASGTALMDAGTDGIGAVQQASAKLAYRLRGAAAQRHSVHLESSVSRAGGGAAHALKLRRRGGARMDLALKLHPRKQQASLEFSIDILLMSAAMETALAQVQHNAALAVQHAQAGVNAVIAADKGWVVIMAALLVAALVALRVALAVISFIYVYFLRPGKKLKSYGSWAVVTGATDGIGKAYSNELARKGLNLVIVSRTQSRLDACAEELRAKHGVEVATCAADLTQIDAAALERISATLGAREVGLLVNNAGMSYDHPAYLEEVPAQTEVDLITINTVAPTLLAKLVLPGMIKRGRGVIVNVGSGNGLLPAVPLLATYAGTKAFVNQFSRSLDAETRPLGVRVQDQPPLFVATKMSKIRRARLDAPTPEVWARAAARQIGYGSSMTPYWFHGLMLSLLQAFVPAFLINRHVRAMHVGFRGAALRRKAREEAVAASQALNAAVEPKKRK